MSKEKRRELAARLDDIEKRVERAERIVQMLQEMLQEELDEALGEKIYGKSLLNLGLKKRFHVGPLERERLKQEIKNTVTYQLAKKIFEKDLKKQENKSILKKALEKRFQLD